MSLLVLDTSAAAPLLLADEAGDRLPAVAEAMTDEACIVPAIWTWEVANLLWKVSRAKRIEQGELAAILRDIAESGIVVDRESVDLALGRTLELANRHDLTAYDAAYLELALRVAGDLATFDSALRRAALSEGVRVHPA